MKTPLRPVLLALSAALSLALAVADAAAAQIQVKGNQTSDVIAVGRDDEGNQVGARETEHPGDTGLVTWSGSGVSLFQDLAVDAPGAHAELHLSGQADIGTLGINGNVTSNEALPQGVGASAEGGIHAEWRAGLTIFGAPGLPSGSPVEILATVVVHGDGSINNGHNDLWASFAFPLLGPTQSFACQDFEGGCSFQQVVTLQGEVGGTYSLRAQLDLLVASATDSNNGIYESSASVAAGNTSQLYLDVLTPGASYLLDNGMVLPTAPVPEPASLWLMLAGALGLGLRLRCRVTGAASDAPGAACSRSRVGAP